MICRFNGYLIRALNELASLTAGCKTSEAKNQIRVKSSIHSSSAQPGQRKSFGMTRRRKYNRG